MGLGYPVAAELAQQCRFLADALPSPRHPYHHTVEPPSLLFPAMEYAATSLLGCADHDWPRCGGVDCWSGLLLKE